MFLNCLRPNTCTHALLMYYENVFSRHTSFPGIALKFAKVYSKIIRLLWPFLPNVDNAPLLGQSH